MLVQSIIAVAIMSVVSLLFATMTTNSIKESKRIETKYALISVKNYVNSLLNSNDVWKATLVNPANKAAFSCVETASTKCSNTNFQLFDGLNQPLTADPKKNPGFSLSTQTCTGFNALKGNSKCPAGLTLTYKKVCSTLPCTYPNIEVSADFEYNDGDSKRVFNTKNMSFKMIKSSTGALSGNIVDAGEVVDTTNGISTYGSKTSTLMHRKTITKKIFVKETGLLAINSGGKMELNPGGLKNAHLGRNYRFTLSINGIPLNGNSDNSSYDYSGVTQAFGTGSWTKVVQPGWVTITIFHQGWVFRRPGAPAIWPKTIFTSLSYTLTKQ